MEDNKEEEDDADMVNMLDKESPPWEIKVRRADNGFILTKYEHDENGVVKSEILVEDKEEKRDEEDNEISYEDMECYNEAATMKEVFLTIGDFFGYSGNKYDKYRLRIHVNKQN